MTKLNFFKPREEGYVCQLNFLRNKTLKIMLSVYLRDMSYFWPFCETEAYIPIICINIGHYLQKS